MGAGRTRKGKGSENRIRTGTDKWNMGALDRY